MVFKVKGIYKDTEMWKSMKLSGHVKLFDMIGTHDMRVCRG